jgi:hypothetical protein
VSRSISPLELLHPDGPPIPTSVIGSATLGGLVPEHRIPPTSAGLVLVVPTRAESRDAAWLVEAAARAAAQVDEDGLVYACLPVRARMRFARLLRSNGMAIEARLMHVPKFSSPRRLIPLGGGPLSHTLAQAGVLPDRLRPLFSRALRASRFDRVLERAPGVALVARRAGARRLAAWTHPSGHPPPARTSLLVSFGWRDPQRSVVFFHFADGRSTPALVTVVTTAPARREVFRAAGERFPRLAASAREAGVRVPELLDVIDTECATALVQQGVCGTVAATLIARRRLDPLVVVRVLAAWLGRWADATACRESVPGGGGRTPLLDAAESLLPFIPDGGRYLTRLRALLDRAVAIPCVATHNDLTMWNVLWRDHTAPAVIDWETADGAGWPTVDFVYSAADALLAGRRDSDRLAAFLDCFDPDTGNAEVRALHAGLASRAGLSAAAKELCFHACWIHHAHNEIHAGTAPENTSFLPIVRWLAARPSLF